MTEIITVASANTQMGQLLSTAGRLGVIAHNDVLLLQEVTQPTEELSQSLAELDLKLAFSQPETGLAIAIGSDYEVDESSKLSFSLQESGRVAKFIESSRLDGTKFRLRGRGLISATIRTPGGKSLVVATTHPTVPLRFKAHRQQVLSLPVGLPNGHSPLVLGADMNYWPRPGQLDTNMIRRGGLRRVDIGQEATFDIGRTGYAWLGRLGINLNGQMDAMYFRGNIKPMATNVRPIASDHKAIVVGFELPEDESSEG